MRFHLRPLLVSMVLGTGLSAAAMAQDEDTGDTGPGDFTPSVQLTDAEDAEKQGCSVIAAPAAVSLAAFGLFAAARRRS